VTTEKGGEEAVLEKEPSMTATLKFGYRVSTREIGELYEDSGQCVEWEVWTGLTGEEERMRFRSEYMERVTKCKRGNLPQII